MSPRALSAVFSILIAAASTFNGSTVFAAASLPFTETFENFDTSNPNGWYDSGCGNNIWRPTLDNPQISSARAFSGSKSVRYYYNGHQPHHMGIRPANGLPEWPQFGGCSAKKYHELSREVWYTWMEFIEPGFEVDEIGTKALQVGYMADGKQGYAWLGYMGSFSRNFYFGPYIPREGRFTPYTDGVYDQLNMPLNMSVPTGQWVCLEVRFVASALGQADGSVTAYMNGNQTAYHDRLRWGDTYLQRPYQDMKFQFIGLYVQDGMGTLYRDNITVSKTRTAACTGGSVPPPPPPPPTTPPPPPTTPPPPPAGAVGSVNDLAAASSGSASVNLTFTQVGDGTGQPAKYEVRMASGASANWPNMTAVALGTCASPLSGTATSGQKTCTVTGLSAGTQYQFQLAPFRGTLNVDAVFGPLSNAATATTAAAAAPTDINGDGRTTITDIQLLINHLLDRTQPCGPPFDVNGDGQCSVTDVQRTVNAALGL